MATKIVTSTTTTATAPTTATTFSSSTLAHIVNGTSESIVTTMATLVTSTTQLLSPSLSHSGNSTVVDATSLSTLTKSSPPSSSSFSSSSLHPATQVEKDEAHSGIVSGFIFQFVLTILFFTIILAAVYVIRKRHLDKLRHYLMPRYNFDPSGDGEDWETELLDDQLNLSSSSTNSSSGPSHRSSQLKLDTGLTHGLTIHKNTTETSPKSLTSSGGGQGSSLLPNASSGLLSSNDSHGSSGRRMYTTEQDPIV